MKKYCYLFLFIFLYSTSINTYAARNGILSLGFEGRNVEFLHEIYNLLSENGFKMAPQPKSSGVKTKEQSPSLKQNSNEDWGDLSSSFIVGAFFNKDFRKVSVMVVYIKDQRKASIIIEQNPKGFTEYGQLHADRVAEIFFNKYAEEIKVGERRNYSGKW